MIKYIRLSMYALSLFILGLSGCDQDQEVADIIDPTTKSLVTITTDSDLTSVSEGDTIIFNVAASKMVLEDILFTHVESDLNTSIDGFDYTITSGTLEPYSLETTVTLIVADDGFAENTDKLAIEIGAYSLADTWQLSPESDVMTLEVDVMNVNDPDALSISMEWEDIDHVIDFDLLVEHADQGSWSADGATSSNPEIDNTIRSDYEDDINANDGTYFVGVDPFDVPDGDISFTINVGYPDGTVEIFEGVWNNDKIEDYAADEFTAWGIPMYRMASVVQVGNSYTVSFDF